jgi:hypothetical protein
VKNLRDSRLKPARSFLGVLVLLAIVTILPHAFAITYTDANNPAGPLQTVGWTAGLAIAGILSGFGVWTAVRRR